MRLPWVVPLLIAAAGTLAYLTSFSGVFLFDDRVGILSKRTITDPQSLSEALVSRRPVVNLTFAANYALGGEDARGYHAVNLAVHVLAALTLLGVVRRTLLRAPFRDHVGRHAAWVGGAVALLWVVHPLTTQAVTYLVQRAESMMGLFYLLTLYSFIRADDAGSSFKRSLWYGGAGAACALGMASKAIMATAPVVVFLYDSVFLGGSLWRKIKERWVLYLGLALPWSILVFLRIFKGVIRPLFVPAYRGHATVGFGYEGVTPLEYLLSQPGVILHYLRLSIWPRGQCLDYGWPVARSLEEILLPALVIGALLLGAMWALWRRHWLGFVGAWFFVILAPTSSFIPIKDLAFEHRMYLPLASVVVVAVLAGWRSLERASPRLGIRGRGVWLVCAAAVTVVATALGATTSARNRVYHCELAMWQDVVTKRPENPRGRQSLGNELAKRGRPAEAIEQYRIALVLAPGDARLRVNLGAVLFAQGELDEALEHLTEALRLRPRSASAHANIGKVLEKLDRTGEAEVHYRRATRLMPDLSVAHHDLGVLLAAQGRGDEALPVLLAALRVDPDDVEARSTLGMLLVSLRRLPEAIGHLEEAVRLRPRSAEHHNNLGAALAIQGRLDDAAPHFRRALEIEPANTEASDNLARVLALSSQARQAGSAPPPVASREHQLGSALVAQGRFSAAESVLRRATQADPDDAVAHNRLGVVLDELGRVEEAREHYVEALRVKPDFPEAHRNLGNSLGRSGDLDGAIEHFSEVVRLRPDLERVHNDLGVLLLRTGDVDRAQRHLEHAVELDPGCAPCRRNLARAHLRRGEAHQEQGRMDDALREYREAARIAPDLAEARERLQSLLAAR